MMNNWVELLVTYDDVEVQIVKNILEAEGIQVVVNSLKVRPFPTSIGRIGEVKLLVREKDIEKAKDILKIMKNESTEK